jgi:glyoxylase-like metal-dependent hydrolase (beta-lactamase superfamily II)|tara:strand:+ start:4545 stop:5213 length:669 start_codon:yes stop_codon:yes gene_type:complete
VSTVFNGKYWSIQRFISGFSNNAFLITCARSGSSVIIDTPANPFELIQAATNSNVEAILITHGHRDHVEGFYDVSESFTVPTGIGSGDRNSLPASAPVNIDVSTDAIIVIGNISLQAMATPGHTRGSTCYLLESNDSEAAGEEAHVFTGDTLFPGGPGKSSSPEALRQILESLEKHIFPLPESTVVLPGHGEFTTIGDSQKEYAMFSAKPLDPNLYGDVTWG